MKTPRKPAQRTRIHANKRAVSAVISTVILTSVLLAVILIASFVSLNILSSQMASTEFELAKSSMLLLDTTVQDVALRPGAGGYVQFNQMTGGIGIVNQTTNSHAITVTGGATSNSMSFTGLIQFVYQGGSAASVGANTILRGDSSFARVNMSQGLGFLRLEQDNGAKIKLDYNRVRIVSAGLINADTNLVQINLIRLINGTTTGSGTVNVQVQNIKTNITTWQFASGTINITIHQHNENNDFNYGPYPYTSTEASKTVVVFSETQVQVSIT